MQDESYAFSLTHFCIELGSAFSHCATQDTTCTESCATVTAQIFNFNHSFLILPALSLGHIFCFIYLFFFSNYLTPTSFELPLPQKNFKIPRIINC